MSILYIMAILDFMGIVEPEVSTDRLNVSTTP